MQLIGIREGLGVLLGSRELLFVKWVLVRFIIVVFA